MATIVTSEQYYRLDGQLGEIKRQIRQENGYPFDPDRLARALQAVIEGQFEVTAAPPQVDHFIPIPDAAVPERYKATCAIYRQLATEQGIPVSHPVCYRVRAGFTFKIHAPKAGPCHDSLRYLQDWNFPDEATKDCFVFWVPGVLRGSTSKDVVQQRQLLSDTRTRLALPAHHLIGFGNVALVAGLMLAHFKATDERIPLVVRIDTCDADGDRLRLFWGGGELYCARWFGGGKAYGNFGVLALGVELGS
ncbi:MAG: hypothetical protein UX09_C0052G0002 [Candidatus Uhrbacteria bacterium GW2011_GWE2_45_35]|uniref:Uncharacterized protein n=2 Tax=Candidatus Uhriibacteriota TaxID=1752732 RepID=A0A0G1LJA6_9BACT|nr:MAG: hypothetical protein UW63_C0066G0001 [Candidatus Uhrbacteria bacterium GW2011_GWF2_44_350]KKU06444.1 MAG: hypothetical protein UX09_C0052G0002 [Candidatus Uhrbacteria bacterium GW2011_GWE2_45_35]HBR80122.1 hypothetical protein [Candidatus Uhrbacteria bacterium]